jgi:hypothetical protein
MSEGIYAQDTAKVNTADKLAAEMCPVLENLDYAKPETFEAFVKKMEEVSANNAYRMVSEEEIRKALKNRCPKGHDKFVELMGMSDSFKE